MKRSSGLVRFFIIFTFLHAGNGCDEPSFGIRNFGRYGSHPELAPEIVEQNRDPAEDDIPAVSVSPDGKTLVTTGAWDNVLRVWDFDGFQTKRRCTVPPHHHANTNAVTKSVFSPDSKLIATFSFYQPDVHIVNAQTCETMHRLEGHTPDVEQGVFVPGGNSFITGDADGVIRIWSLETGKVTEILKGHDQNIMALSLIHHNGYLVSGACSDSNVNIWDINNGQLIHTLQSNIEQLRHVTLSEDGNFIATRSAEQTYKIWKFDPNTIPLSLELMLDLDSVIDNIMFSKSEAMLVACCYGARKIKLWDLKTGKMIKNFRFHRPDPEIVKLAPRGDTMAVGYESGHIDIIDSRNGTLLHALLNTGKNVHHLEFLSNGAVLVSTDNNSVIHVCATKSGSHLSTIKHGGDRRWDFEYVLFESNGKPMAATCTRDRFAYLWDLASGNLVTKLRNH